MRFDELRLFPDLQLFAFSSGSHVQTQSGGDQVDEIEPEIVRIGVSNARITCVTPQRVEYVDEAGKECFVDLDECSRNSVQSRIEDEGDFVVMTSEDRDAAARYVALRDLLHDPAWIEFRNQRRTRFEFGSSNEARGLKLQLMRLRWRTDDAA